MNRKCIQQFVAEKDRRARGLRCVLMQFHGQLRSQRFTLRLLQSLIWFQDHISNRVEKHRRNAAAGFHDIACQSSIMSALLDDRESLRSSLAAPGLVDEFSQQFSKEWPDTYAREEVTGSSDPPNTASVVAESRLIQRHLHDLGPGKALSRGRTQPHAQKVWKGQIRVRHRRDAGYTLQQRQRKFP